MIQRFKKYLPTHTEIEKNRYLTIFGDTIKQRELWTFNRSSTSKGIGIGLFCAFLPMPFESLVAAFMAISLRANIPLSITGVLVSNPITWVPLYTPCYLMGARILNIEPIPIEQINILELGLHYFALWFGCLIVGIVLGLCSCFLVNFIWRSGVRQKWRRRQQSRKLRKNP